MTGARRLKRKWRPRGRRSGCCCVVTGGPGVVDGAELAIVVLPEAVPGYGAPPIGAPEGGELLEVEGPRRDAEGNVRAGLAEELLVGPRARCGAQLEDLVVGVGNGRGGRLEQSGHPEGLQAGH